MNIVRSIIQYLLYNVHTVLYADIHHVTVAYLLRMKLFSKAEPAKPLNIFLILSI